MLGPVNVRSRDHGGRRSKASDGERLPRVHQQLERLDLKPFGEFVHDLLPVGVSTVEEFADAALGPAAVVHQVGLALAELRHPLAQKPVSIMADRHGCIFGNHFRRVAHRRRNQAP